MKNKALNLPYKLLIILSIFAILPACSISDDDEDELSNSAPSVSVGEDQTVNQGATVDLVGVASDSDGSISSWLWKQTSGSHSVTIKNSTTSNAYFSAPTVDTETTLVFELEVKDNDGASVSDSMRVTVLGPGDSVNPLPDNFEAEAGDGQVTLTWTHHSGATYNIYRSSDPNCELANYTTCTYGALFTSKSSGFVDDDLTNGTTYYYWIEAILNGVTYLDGDFISATPRVDDDIDLTDGLVAHYEFENNADDSSGNGNDGEEFGGVSYVDGVIGQAASFDGVDDYLSVDSDDSLNPDSQLSIAMWLNISSYTNTWSPIVHKGGAYTDSHENREYSLWVNDSKFFHLASAGDNDRQKTFNTEYGTAIEGEWIFYVAIIDRSSNITKVYLDGELTLSESDSYSSFNNNDDDLRIGWSEEVRSNYHNYDGLIDDLRIYNRTLSVEEIQALYEMESTLYDGLVAHYEFEGDTIDSSVHNNDGESYGGISYTDGMIGQAASFDGVDDYISVNSDDSLNPDNQLSIAMWLNISSYTNTWSPIVHKGGAYTSSHENREYSLWINDDKYFHLASAGDNDRQKTFNTEYSTAIEGEWIFYVAVIDRLSNATKVYLDGELTLSESDSYSSFNNNDDDLRIGWSEEVRSNYHNYNGLIDDLRIYNRALSAEEIKTLYELGEN